MTSKICCTHTLTVEVEAVLSSLSGLYIFLRRSGAPMTQTSTLCSHRSISQCIEELWSMPCIISWAPALRARPPQDVGQSLLVVVLRRLPEPSTRKIAAQEPPSSAGHNDVPHADLARVSMGRDAGRGAYSDARRYLSPHCNLSV